VKNFRCSTNILVEPITLRVAMYQQVGPSSKVLQRA